MPFTILKSLLKIVNITLTPFHLDLVTKTPDDELLDGSEIDL